MALLTKSGQIGKAVIVAVTIQVRGRKRSSSATDGMGLEVLRPAELAAATGTAEADEAADQLPLGMV
jgi:hypothetical protein